MDKNSRCLEQRKSIFILFFHRSINDFFFPMYYMHPIWRPPPPTKPRITKIVRRRTSSTIWNLSSTITTTTQMTDLTKVTVLTSSSIWSTTVKNNRNKIYVPLSISLVSIILCISFSYWICLCLKHYLNVRGNSPSIDSSYYDADDQQTIERRTSERRWSNDSVNLFRY